MLPNAVNAHSRHLVRLGPGQLKRQQQGPVSPGDLVRIGVDKKRDRCAVAASLEGDASREGLFSYTYSWLVVSININIDC